MARSTRSTVGRSLPLAPSIRNLRVTPRTRLDRPFLSSPGSVGQIERRRGVKVDLVIICGDFQAIRNEADFESMAVPAKFRAIESFWRYYAGAKVAPWPTVIIGGNHEASNYMLELFHGGWVAPNIYYLGMAGVVRFGGLRIGGISGIWKSHDYRKGHFERPPYDRSTIRSAYHVRELQVFQVRVCSATSSWLGLVWLNSC